MRRAGINGRSLGTALRALLTAASSPKQARNIASSLFLHQTYAKHPLADPCSVPPPTNASPNCQTPPPFAEGKLVRFSGPQPTASVTQGTTTVSLPGAALTATTDTGAPHVTIPVHLCKTIGTSSVAALGRLHVDSLHVTHPCTAHTCTRLDAALCVAGVCVQACCSLNL